MAEALAMNYDQKSCAKQSGRLVNVVERVICSKCESVILTKKVKMQQKELNRRLREDKDNVWVVPDGPAKAKYTVIVQRNGCRNC